MNIKQMVILAVVVVGLVFVVTIATQYLGGSNKQRTLPPGPTGTHLVFAEREFPPPAKPGEPDATNVQEWKKPGHQDYWFTNESGGPLQVGLSLQGCTCSKVEICVLPREKWLDRKPEELARMVEHDATLTWQPLQRIEEDRKGVTVPEGGAGWVRLSWNGTKSGAQRLTATLWTQVPAGEVANVDLAVAVTFVEPIFCHEEQSARDPNAKPVSLEEKQLGKIEPGVDGKASFICWSTTRPDFTIKPEPTLTPCVQVGEPEKLANDGEVCKQLAERFKLPVRCAYRVPVTVREQMGDTQLDLGTFRYRIGLTSELGTTSVFISGEVEGPVTLVTEQNRSFVEIGKFASSQGAEVDVTLISSEKNLRLQLDEQQNQASPHLRPEKLEEIPQNGGKTWTLKVKIPPGRIEGRFPNRDSRSTIQESAIYLQIYRTDEPGKSDKPWRRIRIPIVGEATAR